MRNKQALFDALDSLYEIIAEPIRPEDKEQWKEETWNRLNDKSDTDFDAYVQSLKDIASINRKE